jgi:hypothetical protein
MARTWKIRNMPKNKYNARKVKTPEGEFASQKEYTRWCELKMLEQAGVISNLRRQVRYELIPKQVKVTASGRKTERAVNYVADHVYIDNETGLEVVEDSKGHRTKDYVIKRKLMLWVHDIAIKET